MIDLPLVSVITPSYNSKEFIQNTINSVINQTYSNWEMLITDDCSTDNTFDTLSELAKMDDRIKIFGLANNGGPGVARNHSISQAKGRFLAFLDSDDLWLPNKLEVQINSMLKNSWVFSYTSYQYISEAGDIQDYIVKVKPRIEFSDILKTNYVGCSTAVYDTHFFDKVYMPEIRKRQDWGLWHRLLKKHGEAFGIDQILTHYRVRHDSVSSNKFGLISYQWSLYRKVFGLGKLQSIRSLVYWMWYAVSGRKNKGI